MSSAPSSPSKRSRDDDSDGDASNSVGRDDNLASPAKKAKTSSFTDDKHLHRHQRTRTRLPKSPQRTPNLPVNSASPFPLILTPNLNLHDNSLEDPQHEPPQDVSSPRTPSPIEGAGGLSAPSGPNSRADNKIDDRDGVPKGVASRTSGDVLGDGEFEKLSLGGDGGGDLLDAAVGSLAPRH